MEEQQRRQMQAFQVAERTYTVLAPEGWTRSDGLGRAIRYGDVRGPDGTILNTRQRTELADAYVRELETVNADEGAAIRRRMAGLVPTPQPVTRTAEAREYHDVPIMNGQYVVRMPEDVYERYRGSRSANPGALLGQAGVRVFHARDGEAYGRAMSRAQLQREGVI